MKTTEEKKRKVVAPKYPYLLQCLCHMWSLELFSLNMEKLAHYPIQKCLELFSLNMEKLALYPIQKY